MIPESKRPLFIEAERKQWEEHLHLRALRPLSLEESRALKHSNRVLTTRFAYRDKNLAKRRLNPEVEWRPKSRLVVSGQTDPDIVSGALRTDSPTVSRTAVMTLLQIAASRQNAGWGASAGDVTAASQWREARQGALPETTQTWTSWTSSRAAHQGRKGNLRAD